MKHKIGDKEYDIAFDELVPENRLVMSKATFENLTGTKLVAPSIAVRRTPAAGNVRRHPSAATAERTLGTLEV